MPVFDAPNTAAEITVFGSGAIADAVEQVTTQALTGQGWGPARESASDWIGLQIDGARLVMSDGRSAQQLAAAMARPDIAVFDRPLQWPAPGPATAAKALAFALNPGASAAWQSQAATWLHALGFTPLPLADTPGLVVARTVAMLINEAADAVLQGVCTADGANAAMKLGVNYPQGPFEWLQTWGTDGVVKLLDTLDAHYRGERYRTSPWLRRQVRPTPSRP